MTGYDFLADAANAVRTELQKGTGVHSDTLIAPNNLSPEDPLSWKATDLGAKLLGSRHDIMFLAGHFSANSALAADFKTSLLTTDLAASAVDMKNSIVFSAGCHSGYNIVDTDAIPGVTQTLDWTQAFAQKQATLIAGTGYQYGDTDFIEYSERLYRNFARQLLPGTGPVPIGEALVKAKLEYLAATPDIRGIHEKALLEATLFGLPMLGVNMQNNRGGSSATGGAVTPQPVASGPAATLGLRTADFSVGNTGVATNTVSLTNVQGGNVLATWLSGPDGVVSNPAEPALPLAAINVTPTDGNIVLRGVGFRGGNYTDSTIVPLTGAPTTELRGVHVPFVSPVFFPMRTWTVNYFGALSGGGGTSLLVTPAQHRAFDIEAGTSTLRRYGNLDLRLYYSGNLGTVALSDAPTIVGVDAQPDSGGIAFAAQVVGDPKAAIHQVWITHTDGLGVWQSLDLDQCVRAGAGAPLPTACAVEDSRIWMGRLPTAPASLRYVVQAASGTGLVTLDDNRGLYFAISGAPASDSAVALVTAPTSATFGDSLAVTVELTSIGQPVAGKSVRVAIGGAARAGTTGADGRVTVSVPVAIVPGSYRDHRVVCRRRDPRGVVDDRAGTDDQPRAFDAGALDVHAAGTAAAGRGDADRDHRRQDAGAAAGDGGVLGFRRGGLEDPGRDHRLPRARIAAADGPSTRHLLRQREFRWQRDVHGRHGVAAGVDHRGADDQFRRCGWGRSSGRNHGSGNSDVHGDDQRRSARDGRALAGIRVRPAR